VVEVVLYEHLDKPYISGSVVLLDDANLLEDIDFQGSERIYISIKVPESSQTISRSFYIREIQNAQNTNDNAQVLVLSIVDQDYYLSSLINLQKKYDGKPNEIIKNIISDHMPWKLLKKRNNVEEIQAPMRFIVPNMTPMGAMQAITNRATDDTGSPYFLFAVLADEDLRYYSLRQMFNRPAINSRTQPYRFNQKIAQDDRVDPALSAYNITKWEYQSNENLNRYIINGDVGAQYQYHDPLSNLTASYVHNIDDIFTKLASTMVFPRSPIYDNQTTVRHQGQDKKLHNFESKVISNIATSRTFEEINNIHEDNSAAFHRTKSVSKSLKNFLTKSNINITVPGINFLSSNANVTVGNLVSIEAYKNIFPEDRQANLKDNKKSGDYLVYATRHSFNWYNKNWIWCWAN
jgi:hypothetical protein